MKNLFIALAIVFGLCLQSAEAQTATQQPDKEKVKAEVAEKVKAQLAKYDKELQLTTEQKAQIKTILTEQMEKLEPVLKEYQHKTQAIKEETRGRLHGILTQEQRTKLDKMKSMDAEYGKKLEPVKEPPK
jgi:Spy/CpxP family protein refolding chaperone